MLSAQIIETQRKCSDLQELAAQCRVKNHMTPVSVDSSSCHHSLTWGSLALRILGLYDKTMERVYTENVYIPSHNFLLSVQGVHKPKT